MPKDDFKRPRRPTGTYSLPRRELDHAREIVSLPPPPIMKERDTRFRPVPSEDGDVTMVPYLEEVSSPQSLAPSGLSEMSMVEDEDYTMLQSSEAIDLLQEADRENFKSRKALEVLTTSMTPTLKAIMELPSEAFANYLQNRPVMWREDLSVPGVRAWVSRLSPRFQVVERMGRIENKTEAFDCIATAEDRPLGKIYVEMVENF